MADYYGTVAGFKAYCDVRGYSYAGKSDDLILAALVRATTYIDGTYRGAFPGLKLGGRTQVREWPRGGAYDYTGYGIPVDQVPAEVENATYEGGLRELSAPGSLAPDVEAGGGQIKVEKIGPLQFEYLRDGSTTSTYPAIDMALSGILVGTGSPYFSVATRA